MMIFGGIYAFYILWAWGLAVAILLAVSIHSVLRLMRARRRLAHLDSDGGA